MPSFRKMGRRYQGIARVSGHQARTKLHDTKTEALHWAAKTEDEMRGRALASVPAAARTVQAAVLAYIGDDDSGRPGSDKFLSLAEGTRTPLARSLKILAQRLESRLVDSITPDDIKALRAAFAVGKAVRRGTDPAKAKPRSPRTVDNFVAYVGMLFAWCIEQRLCTTNPAARLPAMLRPSDSLGDEQPVRSLTDAEITKLFKVITHRDLSDALKVYLVCGGRRMDVMRLRVRDVVLERGRECLLLRVQKARGKAKLHTVPIADRAALAVLRRRVARREPDALLFPSPAKPTQPIDLRRAWESALEAAGIELPAGTLFHALRHSVAVQILHRGGTLAEVQEMLGHDTAQSTQVYGRIHKQHMRSVAARLGQRKPRHANAGTR